jgi:hypothetical protein
MHLVQVGDESNRLVATIVVAGEDSQLSLGWQRSSILNAVQLEY